MALGGKKEPSQKVTVLRLITGGRCGKGEANRTE